MPMNPFSRAILLLALLPWATPCAAHPKVQLAVTQYDYGQRLPGLLPPVVFIVANRGDAPLTLQPRPCCDIIVTGAETPIPPGQSRRLVVRAAHLHEGLFRKTVRILTNDPDAPEVQIQLKGMGTVPIDVYPGDELTVPLSADQPVVQRVTLACNEQPELKITAIRCSAPYVHCKEVPPLVPAGKDSGRYRAVEITITPDAARTAFEAAVVLGTNCKHAPEVKLRLYALSPNAVTVQPPRLDYDPIDPKEPFASRMLTLTRAAGPFKILEATASDPRMQVKFQLDPSGTYGEVVALFVPGQEKGPFRGTITLRTDDPERPRLTIPYTGEAR
jgi:hypothetical protein